MVASSLAPPLHLPPPPSTPLSLSLPLVFTIVSNLVHSLPLGNTRSPIYLSFFFTGVHTGFVIYSCVYMYTSALLFAISRNLIQPPSLFLGRAPLIAEVRDNPRWPEEKRRVNSFTQNGAADLSDPNGRAIVRTGKGRGGIRIQLRFYHSPSLLLLARFFEKKTSFESRSKENKNNPRLFPGCVENAKPVIYE